MNDGDPAIQLPAGGLITMRIGLEFGGEDAFLDSLGRAVADGGMTGATLIAVLDQGDLGIHIPHRDGPAWNVVPLMHLRQGAAPAEDDWAQANAILERMERYR